LWILFNRVNAQIPHDLTERTSWGASAKFERFGFIKFGGQSLFERFYGCNVINGFNGFSGINVFGVFEICNGTHNLPWTRVSSLSDLKSEMK